MQRGFAIKIIKGFKTINTINAISLAGITPIHIKIKECAEIENTNITGITTHLPPAIELDKKISPSKLLHPINRPYINYQKIHDTKEAEIVNNKIQNIYRRQPT